VTYLQAEFGALVEERERSLVERYESVIAALQTKLTTMAPAAPSKPDGSAAAAADCVSIASLDEVREVDAHKAVGSDFGVVIAQV
jgi:hypothetical protein